MVVNIPTLLNKNMKNCFLKIFILLGILLGSLVGSSSCAATRVAAENRSNDQRITIKTGSAKRVVRTMEAPDFHAVDASRAVGVVIGGTEEIVIEANANVADYVIAEVKHGTLRIGIDNRVRILGNVHVVVRIPNNGRIDAIHGSSAASIRTESALRAAEMEIRLSSAASLDAALKADRCDIRLSSAAELQVAADFGQCSIDLSSAAEAALSGKADSLTANLSSGSELDAYALTARRCKVDVSSGADAKVACSERLTAQASSGGEIRYKGDCAVEQHTSSGGTVKKR